MSVLIEGMEMPKENQRGLWAVIHSDGTVEYDTGDYGWQTLRRSAFNVPPHGKLIDADKLIARLVEQRTVMLHELPAAHAREEGYTKEDYIFERNGDLISMLRNQEAVIPAAETGAIDIKPSHAVVAAGNCTLCGTPLEDGNLFLCKKCQGKVAPT